MSTHKTIFKRVFPYLIALGCVAVLLAIVFKSAEISRNRDMKDGVYTVMTVEATGSNAFCGFALKYNYVFRDHYYDGIAFRDMGSDMGLGSLSSEDAGKRYFLKVSLSNPHTSAIMHDSHVPVWFTLDAPDDGWLIKPTEAELREMMVQDSLKQGLMTGKLFSCSPSSFPSCDYRCLQR